MALPIEEGRFDRCQAIFDGRSELARINTQQQVTVPCANSEGAGQSPSAG
jgi:hypothetical protein